LSLISNGLSLSGMVLLETLILGVLLTVLLTLLVMVGVRLMVAVGVLLGVGGTYPTDWLIVTLGVVLGIYPSD